MTAFISGIMAAALFLFLSSLGGSFAASRYAQFAASLSLCLMLMNSICSNRSFEYSNLFNLVNQETAADYSAVNEIVSAQAEAILNESGYPFSHVEASYSAEEGLSITVRGSDAALQRQIVSLLQEQFGKCTVLFY
ncbi:MAG: hypothetical protein IKV55_05840 [Oscillospiraceae bacterium]|nr:hypothetical protein [Oscillospiraceae bacterium]